MNYQYNQQQVSTPQTQITQPTQQYNYQQYNYQRPISYASGQWNARVRPVSSIDEVRASPIDFDGSIFYFPDIANRKIYTKFIGMDGSVAINMYELRETPTGQAADSSYITREEFENAIMQLRTMYQQTPSPTVEEHQLQQQQTNQFTVPQQKPQQNVSPLQF